MKKNLFCLLIGSLALLAACNKKDSRPTNYTVGSLEKDYLGQQVMIGPQGEKYIWNQGSYTTIPSNALSELKLNRSRFTIGYYTVEGTPQPGSGEDIQMELFDYWAVPTYVVDSYDVDKFIESVPILSLGQAPSGANTGAGETKSTLNTVQNYLDIGGGVFFEVYTGTDSKETPSVNVEIDPQIKPGTGEAADTLNLYFRFNSLRTAEDDRTDAIYLGDDAAAYNVGISVDLEDALDKYSIPVTDASGNDISYILKLNYKIYEKYYDSSSEEWVRQYQTIKWTPNKPYFE